MRNTNFILFWSTLALLDLFLKSRNKFSTENCKKLDPIKAQIVSLAFLLFLQTIQLSENICSYAASQTLLYKVAKGVATNNSIH